MYSPTKQYMEVRMGINKKKHIIYGTRKLNLYNPKKTTHNDKKD